MTKLQFFIKQIISKLKLKNTAKEVEMPITKVIPLKTKKTRIKSLSHCKKEPALTDSNESKQSEIRPDLTDSDESEHSEARLAQERLERKRQRDAEIVKIGQANRRKVEELLQATDPKRWFTITEQDFSEKDDGAFFRQMENIFKLPAYSDVVVCFGIENQYPQLKFFIKCRIPMIERAILNALKKSQFEPYMETQIEDLPRGYINKHHYLNFNAREFSDGDIGKIEELIRDRLCRLAFPGIGSKYYIKKECEIMEC